MQCAVKRLKESHFRCLSDVQIHRRISLITNNISIAVKSVYLASGARDFPDDLGEGEAPMRRSIAAVRIERGIPENDSPISFVWPLGVILSAAAFQVERRISPCKMRYAGDPSPGGRTPGFGMTPQKRLSSFARPDSRGLSPHGCLFVSASMIGCSRLSHDRPSHCRADSRRRRAL